MKKFRISVSDSPIQCLISKDKKLAKVINLIGDIECDVFTDSFAFIVKEIVGQMLSNKVADVIANRLTDRCVGGISAETVRRLGIEGLREIGVSYSKSRYILNFAEEVSNGNISFDTLKKLPDRQIMERLMSVKGIGSWTSKMYLIFVLQRPDVLPYEDGAFIQSFKWLYATNDASRATIENRCKKWKPYSSIASRFLYRALDLGFTKKPFRLYNVN